MDFNITDFNVRLRTIKIRELIIACIIAFVFTLFIDELTSPLMDIYDDLIMVSFLLVLFLFFIYALRGTTGLSNNFHNLFENGNAREIIYVMVINLLFAFFITAMFSSLDVVIAAFDPEWVTSLDFTPSAIDPGVFILEAIGSVIVAPIIEELIFRGILFNRLKIRIGILPAIVLSSFLFAIGHEFGGMTSAFVFGMCMCVLYIKTDNILMSMSVHFLNNLICVFLDLFAMDGFFFQMPFLPITLIVSIVSGILIIVYLYQEIKKIRGNSPV